MTFTRRTKIAWAIVVLALLLLPAPLLPPYALAETLQSALGISWKMAYLMTALMLHAVIYGTIGTIAAFSVGQASTRRDRVIQLVLIPLATVGLAFLIRSFRLGRIPPLANAFVPIVACMLGAGLAVLFRQSGWRITAVASVLLAGSVLWAFFPGASSDLREATTASLRRLSSSNPSLPSGEARFGALLQAAFSPTPAPQVQPDPVAHNQAAVLALGIALGHERLARLVGLDPRGTDAREAVAVRQTTSLRGREDWVRHFCLSAALAAWQNPLFSDAAGVIKEELDSLPRGSGFSFGDLAADRAGIRFASVSTLSRETALNMQERLRDGYSVDDFFPPAANLPEDLTLEQFRQAYGGIGSASYRRLVADIDTRLDRCAALTPTAVSR